MFSDGSHGNWFVGNLALSTGASAGKSQAGVGANGYGNVIEYNVSIGNPRAFRTISREGEEPCVIRHNYAEYRMSDLHSCREPYEAYENQMHRSLEELQMKNPADFGLFSPPREMDWSEAD